MKILFQGDSITDGNRLKDEASRWDKNHQIGHTWAYVVTGKLTCDFPKRFECVNRAVSGNRTPDLAARWQKDAIDIKPDVLMLLVGVNDCNSILRGEMTAEDYDRTYRKLLSDLEKECPALKTVILEPFIIRDEKAAETINILRSYAKDIARDHSAVFVPLQEEFDALAERDGRDWWLWDGVHPTEAGHYMIARKVLRAASGILGADGGNI